MRIKATLALGLVLLLAPLAGNLAAQPTLEEVKEAVAKGVGWLASQQLSDGSWPHYYSVPVTALAVKKLMHHAVDPKWGLGLPSPFDEGNPYKANIEKGLEYILENGYFVDISVQPAGDPDTDGDGKGISFYGSNTYTSGITLMTVCEAVELDRVVESGPLAGMKYKDVAQDIMDYLAFGQNDEGSTYRGGWSYEANDQYWADNSNTGYATLGLGYAEAGPPIGCGLTVPSFVKDELNYWIDYIQNDVNGDPDDGGSGYSSPDYWVNTLKTGNLLQQMAFVGDSVQTQRVKDALDYLDRHWNDADPDPGWKGWGWPPYSANYQATFTIMKGLTVFGIEQFGSAPINWAADFETALLAQQNADGSWPSTYWDGYPPYVLSTTWALLTLQRAAPINPVPVDIKPMSCPNPISLADRGVLPVAILGTAEFDVTQVDPATVQLEGVSPLRWALEDVGTPYEPFIGKPSDRSACNTTGGDGFLDLTLKFSNQQVIAALGPVTDGQVLVLRLTGKLKEDFGGKLFEGEDVVVILKKK